MNDTAADTQRVARADRQTHRLCASESQKCNAGISTDDGLIGESSNTDLNLVGGVRYGAATPVARGIPRAIGRACPVHDGLGPAEERSRQDQYALEEQKNNNTDHKPENQQLSDRPEFPPPD